MTYETTEIKWHNDINGFQLAHSGIKIDQLLMHNIYKEILIDKQDLIIYDKPRLIIL